MTDQTQLKSSVPAAAQITMSKPIQSLSSRVCPRCLSSMSELLSRVYCAFLPEPAPELTQNLRHPSASVNATRLACASAFTASPTDNGDRPAQRLVMTPTSPVSTSTRDAQTTFSHLPRLQYLHCTHKLALSGIDTTSSFGERWPTFLLERHTCKDRLSAVNKHNGTTRTGLLKTYETDQPDLAHNRQCQTMHRRHLTPTKLQTSEHKIRLTSTSNAVFTPGELTNAECVDNLGLSQLPMSPRSQRPPGQNDLQSQRQQRSNRNDDLYLACFCCRADWSAAPFVVAPPGHGSPVVVNADFKVMSMANCAP